MLCFLLQACQQKKQPRNKVAELKAIFLSNGEMNKELGQLFLGNNKLKPSIITLPSGLQYSIIKQGFGVKPTHNDLVSVLYEGQYIDGTVFVKHYSLQNPVKVRVANVIPGWQEALLLMQTGSIWIVFVPPHLAYGQKGVPGIIGPNQTLVYTIHLLTLNKPSSPA